MGAGGSKNPGGFRVFRVISNGPADLAGLEQFFDYVIEVDGRVIESDRLSFSAMIKDREGERIKLTVYNCRTHAVRGMCTVVILFACTRYRYRAQAMGWTRSVGAYCQVRPDRRRRKSRFTRPRSPFIFACESGRSDVVQRFHHWQW